MTFIIDTITPKVWVERPQLGSYAASVSQIWAMIEYELSIAFIILSGSNLALGAAFSTVVPIRTRLQMIGALVDNSWRMQIDPISKLWGSESSAWANDEMISYMAYGRFARMNRALYFYRSCILDTLAEEKPVAYGKAEFKRLILDLEGLRSEIKDFRMYISDLAKAKPFPRSFLLPPE